MKTILLIFATACLAVATAADTYKFTLFQPSYVGDQQLKAGDWELTVDDSRAVLKCGRKKIEADVKVETATEEFAKTTVRYDNGDGKYRVSEIRLGGTTTKLVFN